MNSARLLQDLQQLSPSHHRDRLIRKTIAGAYHCPGCPAPQASLIDDLHHARFHRLANLATQGRYDATTVHNPHQLATAIRRQAQADRTTTERTDRNPNQETEQQG